MDLKEIGQQIKARRKILHINQDDLCALAEISQHTLSDIENGKGNPSLNNFMKVLGVIGLKIKLTV